MRVQIGPVPSGSVTMWVAYARTVLAEAITRPRKHAVRISPEAIEGFESFLDQWDDHARTDEEFLWVAEVNPEQVEYLAHAWFTIAAALAEEADARGFPLAPSEGEAFYQALVTAVLDALAHEGRSLLEFSEQLRTDWPGLKSD
jgi:hypothetical protein